MEVWKDIQGYEGLYQISNLGRVKSLGRTQVFTKSGSKITRVIKEKILRSVKGTEYLYVTLVSKDSIKKQFLVHRLVALNFLKQDAGKPVVNHIDGNPHNNALINVEMVNHSENTNHSYGLGLQKKTLGEKASGAKLKEADVISIRSQYKPFVITAKMLSEKFNVSQGQIINIITRKSWAHV